MGMVVQHNLPAINSHRQLGINNNSLSKSLEKLSSGFRINRAADDAAGLAISEKMRGQISGLTKASENSQDGISLIQTAEGALTETHSILQRMRELAVQSSNGTYQNEVDRENIDEEVKALKSEIDRISTSTHYNGIQLLDGSLQGGRVTSVSGAPRDPNLATSATGVSNADVSAATKGVNAVIKIDLNSLVGSIKGNAGGATGTIGANSVGLDFGSFQITNATTLGGTIASGASLAQADIDTMFTKNSAGAYTIGTSTFKGVCANGILTLTADSDGAASVAEAAAGAEGRIYAATALGANAEFADGTNANTVGNKGSSKSGAVGIDTKGVAFKEANTNISVRDSVKEHTVFNVGGKTYEVVDAGTKLSNGTNVTNAMILDSGNRALVVDMASKNLGAQVVNALSNALTTPAGANTNLGTVDGGGGTFKVAGNGGVALAVGEWMVKTSGNTLEIYSQRNGVTVNDINTNATMNVGVSGPITAAQTTLDMKNVEYGMTVKVGDKNYEIVKNANDIRDDKNIAVVLDDINTFNANTVAKALFDKVKTDSSINKTFDIKHDGNARITLTEKSPKGDSSPVGVEVANAGVTFQIGANGKADQKVSLQVDDMGAANLGVKDDYGTTTKSIQDINVGTRNSANESIEVIDAAINQVSGTRATMGALQNRLEHTIKNLDVAAENLTAAESRIRDVDMAKEMMNFSKSQILSQASQAMLAQANTLPQGVLQLLQ